MDTNCPQLSQIVSTSDRKAVLAEIKKIFLYHYSRRGFRSIKKNAALLQKLFEGKFAGYRACNTEYHNLSHTMDAALASARLIDGYNIINQTLSERTAINLLNAALFHDTGYIQESWDTEGTGAKYTSVHVERSVAFLESNQHTFRLARNDISTIANLIRCTGLSVEIENIPFSSEEDQYAGCILGTSDILGQMADRAYLEKLIFLYYEFSEANIQGFSSEFDLLRKTVDFYDITKKRMADAYRNVFIYARHHFKKRYGIDKNLYIEAIDRHMDYLRKIIEDETTNFRHKLKRGAWVHTHRGNGSAVKVKNAC